MRTPSMACNHCTLRLFAGNGDHASLLIANGADVNGSSAAGWKPRLLAELVEETEGMAGSSSITALTLTPGGASQEEGERLFRRRLREGVRASVELLKRHGARE